MKNTITRKEIETFSIPFNKNLNEYMVKYVIPEVIAFQLSNMYYRGFIRNSSLEQYYNGLVNVCTFKPRLEEVKEDIIELLTIKYNLKVENEDPLVLKKYE